MALFVVIGVSSVVWLYAHLFVFAIARVSSLLMQAVVEAVVVIAILWFMRSYFATVRTRF